MPTLLRRVGAAAALASGYACSVATDPAAAAVDVRGTWQYTGEQVVPRRSIDGVLTITRQTGEDITGTASWEVTDPMGGITLLGGNLLGQAIGTMDVDFDVTLSSGPRRHVAQVIADTMTGVWLDPAGGASGTFRAVRSTR